MSGRERDLVSALRSARAYPHAVGAIEVVETHISWVFLTGELAYKVKKPVKLPFLDFSTLEARKRFCEDELALNSRLAPEIYLEVVPIGGTPAAPRVGATPAWEYAVKMRQFPAGARLDRALAAGAVEAEAVVAFAERLAGFHAELPPLRAGTPAEAARTVIAAARENVRELAELLARDGAPPAAPGAPAAPAAPAALAAPAASAASAAPAARAASAAPGAPAAPAAVARVERTGGAAAADADERARAFGVAADWTERQCAALEPVFAQRHTAGAYRDCHGDMHLENLVVLDGRVVAFDALEFDAALRAGDRMSEAAFVVMDLLAHGRADLAYPFLTRYLETNGDYDGLAVLRFYLVQRALVRAKVRALQRQAAPGAAAYFGLAARLAVPPRAPLLALMHGLSGSGKTSVSTELLRRLPAVRARSDVERKRLLGLAPAARTDSPVAGGAYAGDVSRRTYERLHAIAATGLAHGFDVIVDAAFLETEQREPFFALADARGARLALVDCTASVETLRARIAARSAAGRDASEAGMAVLDWQLAHGAPLAGRELEHTVRVDTERGADYAALARRLGG